MANIYYFIIYQGGPLVVRGPMQCVCTSKTLLTPSHFLHQFVFIPQCNLVPSLPMVNGTHIHMALLGNDQQYLARFVFIF